MSLRQKFLQKSFGLLCPPRVTIYPRTYPFGGQGSPVCEHLFKSWSCYCHLRMKNLGWRLDGTGCFRFINRRRKGPMDFNIDLTVENLGQ